ncbi:MAG: ECF-type sigma factor, partial [Thermoanaerobaculia bacterium]
MSAPDPPDPAGADSGEITDLLLQWRGGDASSLERLMPLVYDEMRRIAARQARQERQGHTLQPTAIVHEAYLRLVDQSRVSWQNRLHFFGVAARTMRRVLVDHARRRRRSKRGGGETHLVLEDSDLVTTPRAVDFLDLDAALDRLQELDAEQSRLVELRYFGGLSIEETAEVLELSPATVKRHWLSAKV